MHNAFNAIFRVLCACAFWLPLLNALPAAAQDQEDGPNYVSGTPSSKYTRYYAPYALQAVGAYLGVDAMNAAKELPNAADVDRVVKSVSQDSTFVANAMKHLRSWRYQFGSEGYITCLELEPKVKDPDCLRAIDGDRWTWAISDGPSFHVWARFPERRKVACNEVSIAFRGTNTYGDWIGNLVPSELRADDHYRQLRRNIDAILKKIAKLDCYKRGAKIVSVGHSLGGGLAQFAALANNRAPIRITKVFAFDPSPVTGASLIDRALREANAASTEIDRVYQTGEALALIRPLLQQYPPKSHRCVRTVLYDFSPRFNIAALHDMRSLAQKVVQYSFEDGQQKALKLPAPMGCSDFERTKTDTDDYDTPSAPDGGSGLIASRTGGPTERMAGSIPAPTGYARNDGFEFSPMQPAAMQHAAVRLADEQIVKAARAAGARKGQRFTKMRTPVLRAGHRSGQL